MKLQVALDTLTLKECITLIDQIQDYVDILEVGTPFLLEAGNEPVKVLKERYPNLEVLADTKIMDAGDLEASGAFAAGADYVTVLGVTHDETITGAVAAAKRFGGKVMMDMICVEDMAKRTKEVEALGVDYICCHTAFDVQATGQNPLAELKVINNSRSTSQSAVAGGVKLTTIDEIIAQQPGIIVVGGAITTASDPVAIAKAMKEKMVEASK
ncbi:3-hexulose-6-phosphate synthase [Erysipelotrichaceae bacterium MTC7]|nr:3-hexulose-6-phosphate synthase [Erysipelotrichaceae bacterium MTC7]